MMLRRSRRPVAAFSAEDQIPLVMDCDVLVLGVGSVLLLAH